MKNRVLHLNILRQVRMIVLVPRRVINPMQINLMKRYVIQVHILQVVQRHAQTALLVMSNPNLVKPSVMFAWRVHMMMVPKHVRTAMRDHSLLPARLFARPAARVNIKEVLDNQVAIHVPWEITPRMVRMYL